MVIHTPSQSIVYTLTEENDERNETHFELCSF